MANDTGDAAFEAAWKVDTDDDGLPDVFEKEIGSDPNDDDTDGDGLGDRNEIDGHTDPLDRDTDDDNLSDWAESKIGTDPENADTDGDGWEDGWEVGGGTDPRRAGQVPATGDERDFQEMAQQKGPARERPGMTDEQRRAVDTDRDGIPDDVEPQFGTDPDDFDSDGDGLGDGVEAGRGTNPADANTNDPGRNDTIDVQPGVPLAPEQRYHDPATRAGRRSEVDASPGADQVASSVAASAVTADLAAGAGTEGFAGFADHGVAAPPGGFDVEQVGTPDATFDADPDEGGEVTAGLTYDPSTGLSDDPGEAPSYADLGGSEDDPDIAPMDEIDIDGVIARDGTIELQDPGYQPEVQDTPFPVADPDEIEMPEMDVSGGSAAYVDDAAPVIDDTAIVEEPVYEDPADDAEPAYADATDAGGDTYDASLDA